MLADTMLSHKPVCRRYIRRDKMLGCVVICGSGSKVSRFSRMHCGPPSTIDILFILPAPLSTVLMSELPSNPCYTDVLVSHTPNAHHSLIHATSFTLTQRPMLLLPPSQSKKKKNPSLTRRHDGVKSCSESQTVIPSDNGTHTTRLTHSPNQQECGKSLQGTSRNGTVRGSGFSWDLGGRQRLSSLSTRGCQRVSSRVDSTKRPDCYPSSLSGLLLDTHTVANPRQGTGILDVVLGVGCRI